VRSAHHARRSVGARLIAPTSPGFDLSYPECELAFPPAPQTSAVVGINGGRDFYQNSCLIIGYD
jgi:hypothetical protein